MNLEHSASGWRAAMERFEALVALPDEERQTTLDRLRTESPELHRRVQALLQADAQAEADGFLASSPEVTDPVGARGGEDLSGLQLGAWRLGQPLGAGGMGQVWLARRADGLYEGEAAVKLLHARGSSADADERFAREGRILARLSHPHIAQLLDAGHTPDGRRFLVLEHVHGERIDVFADRQRLEVRARVRLFLQVCSAVSHAHARLVVHRDLKPSNVLVTEAGDVKLLDFGIAKLLEEDPALELASTAGGLLTPEYASPEQISGAAVTTATDVYGLGMVLFVLLAGRRPYGTGRLSLAQMAREITETDPVPLGAAVADVDVASARSTSPTRLRRELSGDLDRIVRKALRKHPAERYPSALALADDLEAWLEHRSIRARSPSALDRLGKFVRRNPLAFASVVLALLAVAGGAGGVLWKAREARLEASKARAVKEFLLGIFRQNSVEHPDGVAARAATAEQLLDIGVQRIEKELGDSPEVRKELLLELGVLHTELDTPKKAEALFRQLLGMVEAEHGPRSLEAAGARVRVAKAVRNQQRYEEADALLAQAAEEASAGGKRGDNIRARALVARCEISFFAHLLKDDEAVRMAEEAIRLLDPAGPSDDLVDAWYALGRMHESRRMYAEAERALARGIALAAFLERGRSRMAGGRQMHARVLSQLGRFGAGEKEMREATEAFRIQAGEMHRHTVDARAELAEYLDRRGAHAEAQPLFRETLARKRELRGPEHPNTLRTEIGLAESLLRSGRVVDALASAGSIERIRGNGKLLVSLAHARFMQGRARLVLGRLDQAEEALEDARSLRTQATSATDPITGPPLLALAEVSLARGELEKAEARLEEARPRLAAGGPGMLDRVRQSRLLAGRVKLARADAAGALAVAESVLRELESDPERAYFPEVESAAAILAGQSELAGRRPDRALPLLERAERLLRTTQYEGSPSLIQLHLLIAEARLGTGEQAGAREQLARARQSAALQPGVADAFQARFQRVASEANRPH